MDYKEIKEIKLHYSLDFFFSEEVALKKYGKINSQTKTVNKYGSSLNYVSIPQKPISKFIDTNDI